MYAFHEFHPIRGGLTLPVSGAQDAIVRIKRLRTIVSFLIGSKYFSKVLLYMLYL